MKILIEDKPLDPWTLLLTYQNEMGMAGKYGATTVFTGSMRDFNEGDSVTSMTLEHYPAMTEKYLKGVVDEAMQRWPILDTLIVHRVGDIEPGETIVVVAVWAAHRAEAYEANRYIMEKLKSHAPFWKRETLEQGERWVQTKTSGE